ncbi:hypothetical protein HYFRA_00010292 [Hymenoscyphus fraxineus]|uniref:C2H2-type domain-containing protein n=1 Tax=Hymenoscyphus fraxineus TaxID=746836 RepID=A0A9N9L0M2_9HELO|nr:hypothetical protein HYFRA_00010292 [Hymenoscyphus fraxineus]
MSSIKDAFESILDDFKKDLTKKELDKFQFVTLKEFEKVALEIQKDQENTKSMKNMARIKPFLEAMEQFGKVVDVFLNASQFVCFIWGPLKFILQTASTWADSFEIIVDAYGKIGSHIPLLEQYNHCFQNNNHMKRILPLIYSDILEFHRRAMRFFRGRQTVWKQIFKSVWKDYKTRYQSVLNNLQQHKALLAEHATLLHMEQYQSDNQYIRGHIQVHELNHQELLRKLEYQEQAELKRKQSEVLSWFSAASTTLKEHEEFRVVRNTSAGNGSWILKNEKVNNWMELDTPESSVLWINGIPGAGKTILASVIIDGCLEDTSYTTSYFYCKETDEEKNECISILRSLLSQVLDKCPEMISYCYDKSLASGAELRLQSIETAKSLLMLFCEKVPKQCIIIDGIDECNKAERKLLLEFWLEAIQKIDEREPGKVRVAFISQSYPDIEKSLRDSIVLKLTPSDNQKDIESFARSWCLKIRQKYDLLEEQSDFIFESTCIRAKGMFLFAKLVLENLHAQETQNNLFYEIQVDRFPGGLDEAYQRILDRMQRDLYPPQWLIAKQLLGWVVCSKRSLKWREIQAAMSMNLETQEMCFGEKKLRSDIQEYCGSLIQVNGHQVELVHTTAKTYITKSKYVHASIVECDLTGMCLQYLTFDCFDLETDDESVKRDAVSGLMSFQDYAIAKWMDHVQAIVQTPAEDFCQGDGFREALDTVSTGIEQFSNRYEEDVLPKGDLLEEAIQKCRQFEKYDMHEDLLNLYNYIYIHSKKDSVERNKVSIISLSESLARNRRIIEGFLPPKMQPAGATDQLTEFYGENRFKCPKVACYYFHEGFKDAKTRDGHLKRHDRPFICTFPDCSITEFGFASNKELEKHVKTYHPNIEELAIRFNTKAKPVAATPWECHICQKKFTRKFHHTSHIRSHMGEKPFPCPECGRAFTRANDMRRHEKNMHFGKR